MKTWCSGRYWQLLLWLCFATFVSVVTALVVLLIVFTVRNTLPLASQQLSPATSLRKLIILSRHGDRHPEETYPTDPYALEQFRPEGRGQLTNEGKQHMYQLGKNLRSRYGQYLGDVYDPEEVHMESNSLPRCMMSAELVLAGLYPPTGSQVWNSDLLWQPIPVHVAEDKKLMMYLESPCPKIKDSFQNNLKADEYQKLYEENEQLIVNVANNSHVNATLWDIINSVFPAILIQSQMGLQLPEWMAPVTEEILHLFLSLTHLGVLKPEQKRLVLGPLLGDFANHFREKESTLKTKLYSIQDICIYYLQYVLTSKRTYNVYFGSTMILELHSVNASGSEQLEVKLLKSSNYTMGDLHKLEMPGCGSPCYLEAFLKMLEPLIPINWEQECNDGVTSQSPNSTILNTTTADD